MENLEIRVLAAGAVILCLISVLCQAQTHQPSSNLTGTLLTVDAEIATISPPPERLISGVIISTDGSLAATTQGTPIQWRLSSGTYEIGMLGFADDLANPNRNSVNTQVTVTRTDSIFDCYLRLAQALIQLRALTPTYEEIVDALDERGVSLEAAP